MSKSVAKPARVGPERLQGQHTRAHVQIKLARVTELSNRCRWGRGYREATARSVGLLVYVYVWVIGKRRHVGGPKACRGSTHKGTCANEFSISYRTQQ